MMLNNVATVHQAIVTRSNDAKRHGHIVPPPLNRQQKTSDKYPAQPGEWEKAIVVAADIEYLVPDLQK